MQNNKLTQLRDSIEKREPLGAYVGCRVSDELALTVFDTANELRVKPSEFVRHCIKKELEYIKSLTK